MWNSSNCRMFLVSNGTGVRRLLSLSTLLLALALLLPMLACSSGRQVGLDNENQVFPPDQLLPLRVAVATPLTPNTHVAGHEALIDWNESPGQRRMLMNCAWAEGLQNFVRVLVPGTEVFYLGAGRDPLAAVGNGVLTETDSLGVVTFLLDGRSALDVARHRGWTHLVILEHMEYGFDGEGKSLFLATPAAIIDVQEQRIVWQGILDNRHIQNKELGADDSRLPALTSYESTTYRFILDLAEVMNRQLNAKPESRHLLAGPCQEPPALLGDGD